MKTSKVHIKKKCHYVKKFVVTSKIRHYWYVKKFVINSKLHQDVKNTSWCQKIHQYVKNTSKHQKVCHDIKKFVMTSKIRHNVKIRHDVKQCIQIRRDVKKIVITSNLLESKLRNNVKNLSWRQNRSWCQKYVMTSKSLSGREK